MSNSASSDSERLSSGQAASALSEIPQVPSATKSVNSASSRHFWMRTHTYESHRIRYARFCWGKGSEVWGYVHIAGGDCSTPLVQSRKSAVDQLIAGGGGLVEVLALLRSFDNARPGRKSGPVPEPEPEPEPDLRYCFYCGRPATQLCDGRLPARGTCDRPMCRDCVARSGVFIACSRRPSRSYSDTIDYCRDCAARLP